MFLLNSSVGSFAAAPTSINVRDRALEFVIYLNKTQDFILIFAISTAHTHRSGGRPYPEVTVAVLPSSLAKVLS